MELRLLLWPLWFRRALQHGRCIAPSPSTQLRLRSPPAWGLWSRSLRRSGRTEGPPRKEKPNTTDQYELRWVEEAGFALDVTGYRNVEYLMLCPVLLWLLNRKIAELSFRRRVFP
ncbi:unnamed protein product [Natator depressus]